MTKHHNEPKDQSKRKKRGPRRATVAGTGPAAADGPEPRLDELQDKKQQTSKDRASKDKLSARDRWMLEQKPPHY